jgi:uncharacterized surface protein with fasciclin (FAS1) repeats
VYLNSKTLVTAVALAAALPAQDAREASASRPSMNIVQTASKAGSFKTLLAAAKAAGLVETLQSEGPFTVFAPTDDAFAKLPDGTVAKLLKDKEKLAAILTYHVVPGRHPASSLAGKSWAETVEGQSIRIRISDKGAYVDDAKVVKTDIQTSNGIIHVIDSVILPRPDIVDTAVAAGSFKTLVTAVTAAELVEVLKGEGPFTVFAPTDDAFAALPDGTIPSLLKNKDKLSAVLTYHVIKGRVLAEDLPMAKGDAASAKPATVQGQQLKIRRTGDGVTVNGARVVKADVIAGNGVIHVIDKVLLPQ